MVLNTYLLLLVFPDFDMNEFDEQEIGWPTPNGITLEQATEYCRNFVIQSTSGSLCKNVNNVQLDTSLENCVEDIQVRASR